LFFAEGYICVVKDLLDNPVFNALRTKDAHLGHGVENVKWFDEAVSPFAGIKSGYQNGFEDLYKLLPGNRKILFNSRTPIIEPQGWVFRAAIEGRQFVYNGTRVESDACLDIVPLKNEHAEEMVKLAQLTKPGPFALRTIEFGHYHGIFQEGKLVSMTGQRLHLPGYSEISAVCTHPDHLGKGYAAALLLHQLNIILSDGEIPFLHVRADNARAISLYERLGFKENGPMHFYFMQKAST
jgi:ribosomal protein S18 acetylase RimI-like enzyme